MKLRWVLFCLLVTAMASSQSPVCILNVHSGLVMGVSGGSKSNGAPLILWPANGTPSQSFQGVITEGEWFKLVNVGSGLCVGVEGGSKAKGAKLVQWKDDGSANQQWAMREGRLVNRGSGLVVGVWGGSKKQGAQLVQWSSDGSPNQSWEWRQ